MKLALAALAILIFIPAAHADGVDTTIQYTVNVSFALSPFSNVPSVETFQATYELENIGSAPVATGDPFDPWSGGDWISVGPPLVYTTSGPIGPFTPASGTVQGSNFLDLNAVSGGGQIQILFELVGNTWMVPGSYGGYNVNMSLPTNLYFEGFVQGTGTFIGTEVPSPPSVPEPGILVLLLTGIGLVGLAGALKFLHLR